jgi:4-hydroxy-3-polyprenylbenzoate decarboxylase
MPVAVVIGACPALTMAAVMPIPENISEYAFAGLLSSRKQELVNCISIDLKVPADAEIIIEGEIFFNREHPEGPFGDHTGYYNEVENFPVLKVKTITSRKNPIYLSTYTGKPPDEPAIIGAALNSIFTPLIRLQFPEIIDFWLPPEGCSYRIAIVSIKKSYPGQAKRVMMGIWSYLKQFMYTKFIIVVDQEINVKDWKEVMWAVSTSTDPERDSLIIPNTPIDYLDFASPVSGLGSKIGIDATHKIGSEISRNWGVKISMDQQIIDKIDRVWSTL